MAGHKPGTGIQVKTYVKAGSGTATDATKAAALAVSGNLVDGITDVSGGGFESSTVNEGVFGEKAARSYPGQTTLPDITITFSRDRTNSIQNTISDEAQIGKAFEIVVTQEDGESTPGVTYDVYQTTLGGFTFERSLDGTTKITSTFPQSSAPKSHDKA